MVAFSCICVEPAARSANVCLMSSRTLKTNAQRAAFCCCFCFGVLYVNQLMRPSVHSSTHPPTPPSIHPSIHVVPLNGPAPSSTPTPAPNPCLNAPTHSQILGEASPSDREWGIGLHASDPDALNQMRCYQCCSYSPEMYNSRKSETRNTDSTRLSHIFHTITAITATTKNVIIRLPPGGVCSLSPSPLGDRVLQYPRNCHRRTLPRSNPTSRLRTHPLSRRSNRTRR